MSISKSDRCRITLVLWSGCDDDTLRMLNWLGLVQREGKKSVPRALYSKNIRWLLAKAECYLKSGWTAFEVMPEVAGATEYVPHKLSVSITRETPLLYRRCEDFPKGPARVAMLRFLFNSIAVDIRGGLSREPTNNSEDNGNAGGQTMSIGADAYDAFDNTDDPYADEGQPIWRNLEEELEYWQTLREAGFPHPDDDF